MSSRRSIANPFRHHPRGLLVGQRALLALTLSCANLDVVTHPSDDTDQDEIGSVAHPLLAANCSITASNMTALIADGETAVLRLRPTDGKITLNALTAAMAPCEVAPAGITVSLTAWGTTASLGRTVILDYVGGLFLSSATGTASVVIDMTVASNGTNDVLKVRGSSDNDSFVFGLGSVSTTSALNHNAGNGGGQDTRVDVTFKQIEKVIVAGLGGDDVISGGGGMGTNGPLTSAMRIFGAAGDDTLTGGSGNDTIRGGLGDDTMDGVLGSDTIVMHGSGDGNDTADCTGSPTGSDTVDYSVRTADLVLNLDGNATSGELGENDALSANIVNVVGGSGNDAITMDVNSAINHVVSGGPGDDFFVGSGASLDVFDGQTGDDTCASDTSIMTYASRTAGVTVTICDPNGDCAADDDDGDQTLTTTRKSGTAATAADDGMTSNDVVTIAALAGITAKDIGRKIRLTGFQTAANNDTTTGYPITAQTATTVTLNVSGNVMFDETALTPASAPTGLTWSIVGAEKDNVGCAHVTATAYADVVTGDARNNTIRGGAGTDTLTGGAGDDYLYGDAGNDHLWGGIGEDHLIGGADDDALEGGDGDDSLLGEAGNDIFQCDGANASGGPTGSSPGSSDAADDNGVGDTLEPDCDL